MKRKLFAMLLSALLLMASLPLGAIPVMAATTGTTGDCTWELDGTHLTISGNGAMDNYIFSVAPWGTSITSVTIEYGVTTIGDDAFYDCRSLTSVTIPDSVTTIGKRAFCYCTSLTSVTIPNSVTTIGNDAFYDCRSLTSVTIPDSVTTIGSEAFCDCDALTSVTIPDSVTTIDVFAFDYCDSLTSVIIGNGVTSIEYGTFCGCRSLTSVTIPDSVTTIDEDAFSACDALTDVYYSGTEADKANIFIGAYNEALLNATWHYKYTPVCDHVYDNVCDADCNVCGAIRQAPNHVYDHSHDAECNVCGHLRNVADHVYDNEFDADCNVCGDIREVIIPDDAPTFAVDDVTTYAGKEFTVAIRTLNNSGIVSLKLEVGYDTDVLELVGTAEGDFANLSFGPTDQTPFIVNWLDAINPNNTTDGVVVLLTFRVKEGAAVGDTAITLSYDPEDMYDADFNNVTFLVESGTVTVTDYILGDLNNDGNINNKDLGLLQRYINEWDVTINTTAADVDGDGSVNNKDLGLLQRYVNRWDVTLG